MIYIKGGGFHFHGFVVIAVGAVVVKRAVEKVVVGFRPACWMRTSAIQGSFKGFPRFSLRLKL